MKKRDSFSKIDYYLMFLDEFKDQFTVVLLINLLNLIASNYLENFYSQTYLFASFKDYFNELSLQFNINDFFKILGYVYLFAIFVHVAVYKKNIKWIFRFNAIILILTSTYVWSIPTFKSVMLVLENFNLFFIISIVAQFFTYFVVGNEFYQFIKKRIKQPEINHS